MHIFNLFFGPEVGRVERFLCLASIAILTLCVLLMPGHAHAAEISLTPFKETLGDYAFVLLDVGITAVIGWGLRLLHLAGNASAEAAASSVRTFLHGTIDRAIGLAVAAMPATVTVSGSKGLIVSTVVTYVQSQAPGALKKLGVSPEQLARLVEAKLADWLETPSATQSLAASGKLGLA